MRVLTVIVRAKRAATIGPRIVPTIGPRMASLVSDENLSKH